jgi:hypothetical protein
MRQPKPKELKKLMKESEDSVDWQEMVPFELAKPTSIRFSPSLIKALRKLAKLHGERSYQSLLKKWVTERVSYETHLIKVAKGKAI